MSKCNWRNSVTRAMAWGLCWGFIVALPCAATDISPEHASRLVRLVRQDCGSYHGLQLTDDALVATIIHGRPGTAMPPWKNLMTEQEAQWIVERLQTEFPKE